MALARNTRNATVVDTSTRTAPECLEIVTRNFNMKFKVKPDQIDFSKARWAPVINCVVKYKSEILIVKRSNELHFYPGYWNGISGFLDDGKSLVAKVKEEIKEELGLSPKNIIKIKLGKIFHQEAKRYHKTWIVHPVLVEVNTDKINLDWEAQKYRWVRWQDAKKLKLLPGFKQVLENIKHEK